ncbi:MAG: DNA repair protein RecO, partial [Pyrinomonadaceae bacterium]|nr:DNA repair protein RecO [Phycisphaerales bacterium]
MPPIMDEGVCVRQWDWSETSQTVTVLCRTLGLARGLAKGAKRATHPFSGGIELLTRGRVGVIHRPSSELAIITEWDLQETFPPLRQSLAAHHVGLYFAELVQHAVHDHDPHERLYDELLLALRHLETPRDRALALRRFQWAVLVETGYMPV